MTIRQTRLGPLAAAVVALVVLVPGAAAQGDAEAAMTAAARWAAERVGGGDVRVDPHRTGQDAGDALASRIAAGIGGHLGTIEETRRCGDRLDPATCTLAADAVLAIAVPVIRGDQARVRVYAWTRSGQAAEPVARQRWTVVLARGAGGWTVSGVEPE